MNIKKIEINQETGEVEITFIAKNNNDPELQKFYREKLMEIPVDVIPQPALIPAANIDTKTINSNETGKKTGRKKYRTKDQIDADKKKAEEEKQAKKAKRLEEKNAKKAEEKAKKIEEKKNNKKIKQPTELPITGEKRKRGRPKKEQIIEGAQIIGEKKPEANKIVRDIIKKSTEIKPEPEVLKNDLIELSEHITIPDNIEKKVSTSVKIDITVPSEERDDMDTEALQIILQKKDSPMYAIKHIKERAGITMDEARIYCNELWRKYQEEMEKIKADERANALQNE